MRKLFDLLDLGYVANLLLAAVLDETNADPFLRENRTPTLGAHNLEILRVLLCRNSGGI